MTNADHRLPVELPNPGSSTSDLGWLSTLADGVAMMLAVLLLWTGTLKVASWMATGTWNNWLILVGFLELGIAVWIFSGALRRACWWLLVGLFFVFAIYSGVLLLDGTSICGCFGSLGSSPELALLIDVVALVALQLTGSGWKQPMQRIAGVPAALGLLTALVTTFAGARWSPQLLGIPSGLELSPASKTVNVDYVDGYRHQFVIEMRNKTADVIRLVGWTSSCSNFRVVDGVPSEIAPDGAGFLVIEAQREGKSLADCAKAMAVFGSPDRALAFRRPAEIQLLCSRGGMPVAKFEIVETMDSAFVRRCFESVSGSDFSLEKRDCP